MRGLLRTVLFVVIVFGMLSTSVMAANVTARWNTPTMRCDGSPLTSVTGYNIGWGEVPRPLGSAMPGVPSTHSIPACDTSTFIQYSYPNTQTVGNINTLTIDVGTSPQERTFYLAVTTISPEGESTYSNEAVKVVPPTLLAPSPPSVVAD